MVTMFILYTTQISTIAMSKSAKLFKHTEARRKIDCKKTPATGNKYITYKSKKGI